MEGFELKINGDIFSASFSDRIITIIATKNNDKMELSFSGMHTKTLASTDWYKAELEIGDEITISVKDIEQDSEPVIARQFVLSSQSKAATEQELETFLALKKELQAEGLIDNDD